LLPGHWRKGGGRAFLVVEGGCFVVGMTLNTHLENNARWLWGGWCGGVFGWGGLDDDVDGRDETAQGDSSDQSRGGQRDWRKRKGGSPYYEVGETSLAKHATGKGGKRRPASAVVPLREKRSIKRPTRRPPVRKGTGKKVTPNPSQKASQRSSTVQIA